MFYWVRNPWVKVPKIAPPRVLWLVPLVLDPWELWWIRCSGLPRLDPHVSPGVYSFAGIAPVGEGLGDRVCLLYG